MMMTIKPALEKLVQAARLAPQLMPAIAHMARVQAAQGQIMGARVVCGRLERKTRMLNWQGHGWMLPVEAWQHRSVPSANLSASRRRILTYIQKARIALQVAASALPNTVDRMPKSISWNGVSVILWPGGDGSG